MLVRIALELALEELHRGQLPQRLEAHDAADAVDEHGGHAPLHVRPSACPLDSPPAVARVRELAVHGVERVDEPARASGAPALALLGDDPIDEQRADGRRDARAAALGLSVVALAVRAEIGHVAVGARLARLAVSHLDVVIVSGNRVLLAGVQLALLDGAEHAADALDAAQADIVRRHCAERHERKELTTCILVAPDCLGRQPLSASYGARPRRALAVLVVLLVEARGRERVGVGRVVVVNVVDAAVQPLLLLRAAALCVVALAVARARSLICAANAHVPRRGLDGVFGLRRLEAVFARGGDKAFEAPEDVVQQPQRSARVDRQHMKERQRGLLSAAVGAAGC